MTVTIVRVTVVRATVVRVTAVRVTTVRVIIVRVALVRLPASLVVGFNIDNVRSIHGKNDSTNPVVLMRACVDSSDEVIFT